MKTSHKNEKKAKKDYQKLLKKRRKGVKGKTTKKGADE